MPNPTHHQHDLAQAAAARAALAECQRQLALLTPYNAALLELLENAQHTLRLIRESL